MKRHIQPRIMAVSTITAASMLQAAGLATAHPGPVEHLAVSGPAHGMAHAVMSMPAVVIGACVAMAALWTVPRFIKRRLRAGAWQSKAE